jgi:hypothetical protein
MKATVIMAVTIEGEELERFIKDCPEKINTFVQEGDALSLQQAWFLIKECVDGKLSGRFIPLFKIETQR